MVVRRDDSRRRCAKDDSDGRLALPLSGGVRGHTVDPENREERRDAGKACEQHRHDHRTRELTILVGDGSRKIDDRTGIDPGRHRSDLRDDRRQRAIGSRVEGPEAACRDRRNVNVAHFGITIRLADVRHHRNDRPPRPRTQPLRTSLDDAHLLAYARAAKTREGFQRYLDEWVLTPRKSFSPA